MAPLKTFINKFSGFCIDFITFAIKGANFYKEIYVYNLTTLARLSNSNSFGLKYDEK